MNKIYKNCLAYAVVTLLLFGAMTSVASASISIISLATSIMQNHQIDNDTKGSGGEQLCLASGRSSSDCPSYTTTGQGLCLAKGHSTSECSSVSESTALSMTIIDVDGAWDSFYDEYHNTRWMCRGRSTAQFVDAEKCAGKTQIDDTWSGM